jgi:DNA polymerase-3 subunit delta'
VFLILAEYVPPELVTIASRCVRIDFDVLPAGRIADALVAEGVPAPVAAAAAEASGGRLDRARLLAADPEAELRRVAWASVPARLDGTGATAATVAAELLTLVATAGGDVLATRHATEAAALDERAALTGERGGGRREMEERHRREQRRLRTDELRFGLAVLEAAYRDRAAAGGPQARGAVDAARSVQKAAQDLVRNPNEALFVQALMVRLTMAHIGG